MVWAPIPPLACRALFDDSPRVTTAKAIEESRLLFVSRDDFYEVLSDHVDIVEGSSNTWYSASADWPVW